MDKLDSVTIPIPTGNISPITDLGNFIGSIAGVMLILAGIACIVMLIWGGVEWVMSGGDKAKLEEAKNKLTNAVLGLAITAAAWGIFSLVDYFLGLNIAGKESSLEVPTNTTTSTSTKTSTSSSDKKCGNSPLGTVSPGQDGKKYTCYDAKQNCTANGKTFTYNYPFWCLTE